MIKLSSPWLGEEEAEAVRDVLLSQVVSMGFETKCFEEELHEFFGQKDVDVLCVSSCTAAIQLALQCNDIKQGDEVLVPSYTFVGTFQAIKATGALPVPCDVDLDDAFISIDDARQRITSRTRAIVPVLFAGCDQKILKLYEFAREHCLKVVEDAAHCFGDEDVAKRAGTLCFSFDPIKNITCANGGAVLTADKEVARRIKDARLLGVVGDTDARYRGCRSWDAETFEQGWRYHMGNVEAAIGRAQLKKFAKIRHLRQKYATIYAKGLSDVDGIRLFPVKTESAVPHIFPIVVTNGKRNDLQKFLSEKGIQTGVQYKPNHLLKYFDLGYAMPNSVELFGSMLSLPLHPMLLEEEVKLVVDAVKNWSIVAV